MMSFSGSAHTPINSALPFTQTDYFQLVDTTGHVIREDTQFHCIHATTGLVHPVLPRGFIPSHYPPILQRLGVDQKTWLQNVTRFEKCFGRAAGKSDKIVEYAKRLKGEGNLGKWCKGIYLMTTC